jgi:hypothetical protein
VTAGEVTLEFAAAGTGVMTIQAHGTGLAGDVYVGTLYRDRDKQHAWEAHLWPVPGIDIAAPGDETPPEKVQAPSRRLKPLQDLLCARVRSQGPWWSR